MNLPNRKPTRLRNYDYARQNDYYVTICTYGKNHLFGATKKLNEYGKIAADELLKVPEHFDGVSIEKYIMMSNHIHAIIRIGGDVGAERSRPFPTVSGVVGLYKSGVSKRIHEKDPGVRVWQKSFYDRVIRNEQEYQAVWRYIDENPLRLLTASAAEESLGGAENGFDHPSRRERS